MRDVSYHKIYSWYSGYSLERRAEGREQGDEPGRPVLHEGTSSSGDPASLEIFNIQ